MSYSLRSGVHRTPYETFVLHLREARYQLIIPYVAAALICLWLLLVGIAVRTNQNPLVFPSNLGSSLLGRDEGNAGSSAPGSDTAGSQGGVSVGDNSTQPTGSDAGPLRVKPGGTHNPSISTNDRSAADRSAATDSSIVGGRGSGSPEDALIPGIQGPTPSPSTGGSGSSGSSQSGSGDAPGSGGGSGGGAECVCQAVGNAASSIAGTAISADPFSGLETITIPLYDELK